VEKSPEALSGPVVFRRYERSACADPQLRVLECVTAGMERWAFANLSAPYWRLYVMGDEGAEVRWGGRTIPLTPDHVWLIAPDTAFGTGLRVPVVTQCYVHFTLAPALVAAPGVLAVPLTKEMRRWHQRALVAGAMETVEPTGMMETQRTKRLRRSATGKGQGAVSAGIAWQALVLSALDALPAGVLSERAFDPRVQRVLEHIEREPGAAHTLESLAKLAGMHARALIRLFRAETGDTPMASLRARRIALACEWLHHSDRKIDDIAVAAGFCDRYHFTKTFRSLRDITPAAFRVLQQGRGVREKAG